MAHCLSISLLLLWCSIICACAGDASLNRPVLSRIRNQGMKAKMLSNKNAHKKEETPKEDSLKGVWMTPRVKVFDATLRDDQRHCNYVFYYYKNEIPDLRGGTVSCQTSTYLDYWGGNYMYYKKTIELVNNAFPKLADDFKETTLMRRVPNKKTPYNLSNIPECREFAIPKEHTTEGVSGADILIHVSATPFPKNYPQEERVWTRFCQAKKNQQMILVMNYNPEYVKYWDMHKYPREQILKALNLKPCKDGGKALIWTSEELSEMHFNGLCVKVDCESTVKTQRVLYLKDNTYVPCHPNPTKQKFYDPISANCPPYREFCPRKENDDDE